MNSFMTDTRRRAKPDSALAAISVLKDPAASHWLKQSLESALQRDPVDALNDAECLCRLLQQEFQEASIAANADCLDPAL